MAPLVMKQLAKCCTFTSEQQIYAQKCGFKIVIKVLQKLIEKDKLFKKISTV